MTYKIDDINKIISSICTNVPLFLIEQGQYEIGEKLDKEISIREHIEKEIKDLKQRVLILQERIEDLEKRLKTFS